jgi:predicted ABC-class ATPase
MLPSDRLRDKLIVANNKGVQVYREIAGAYRFERFELYLDTIQPDPAAPVARARIRVDQAEAQVPREFWERPAARIAVQDFLVRTFRDALQKHVRTRWSGRAAPFTIDAGGQEVLLRTGCAVAEDFIEVRVAVNLPAEGRKIMARPAQAMFFEDLPAVVHAGLLWPNLDAAAGRRHVETYEDYLALRAALSEHGLVAFVGDGSILGRDSGPGDRPLRGGRAVTTHAPDELAVTITLPHRGPVRGLGVRRGVTLITGNLYSGKSTLLAALANGVYPHVPGDGRELVATVPDAVAIRADVGRRIERVDVSGFVHNLPHSHDVAGLSMERATGTLSMAAAVSEAMELGTALLLFDEDDSAIAFVARDAVMELLIPGLRQAFTPLVERVRALWEQHGVSTIISTGGLGEYLEVADTVIVVENFQLMAATDRRGARPAAGRRPPSAADAAAPLSAAARHRRGEGAGAPGGDARSRRPGHRPRHRGPGPAGAARRSGAGARRRRCRAVCGGEGLRERECLDRGDPRACVCRHRDVRAGHPDDPQDRGRRLRPPSSPRGWSGSESPAVASGADAAGRGRPRRRPRRHGHVSA